MDRPQARLLLRKITQLLDNMDQSAQPPARIERDLLLAYTRQFYEALQDQETAIAHAEPSAPAREAASSQIAPPPAPEPVSEPQKVAVPPPVAAEAPPVPVAPAVSTPAAPAPTYIPEPEAPSIPEPAPVAAAKASAVSIQIEAMPAAPAVEATLPPAERIAEPASSASGQGSQALFALREARDLSDKLRLSRIDDLSRAMGINERFLTINELFGGDHEAFDLILRTLNDLSSFSEARAFLETQVIAKYGWMDDKRIKKAAIFVEMVQRRYV